MKKKLIIGLMILFLLIGLISCRNHNIEKQVCAEYITGSVDRAVSAVFDKAKGVDK